MGAPITIRRNPQQPVIGAGRQYPLAVANCTQTARPASKRLTFAWVSWLHRSVSQIVSRHVPRRRFRILLAGAFALVAASAASAPPPVRQQVVALLAEAVPDTPETLRAEKNAQEALTRADSAAAAEEATVRGTAEALTQVALEWALLRKELAELDALENESVQAQRQLQELDAQLKREQAYLEETEARRGRALAELQDLGIAPAPTAGEQAPSEPPSTRPKEEKDQ